MKSFEEKQHILTKNLRVLMERQPYVHREHSNICNYVRMLLL